MWGEGTFSHEERVPTGYNTRFSCSSSSPSFLIPGSSSSSSTSPAELVVRNSPEILVKMRRSSGNMENRPALSEASDNRCWLRWGDAGEVGVVMVVARAAIFAWSIVEEAEKEVTGDSLVDTSIPANGFPASPPPLLVRSSSSSLRFSSLRRSSAASQARKKMGESPRAKGKGELGVVGRFISGDIGVTPRLSRCAGRNDVNTAMLNNGLVSKENAGPNE